ncbi:MAG: GNAT family N-acetyltransferase [Hamadaea sp.]|uniref:GNAT family N-acetyltransferase n=1 Tax=Hamadaea sp. TaxID=2024425 RepID=UPI0017CBEA38|nr:GNAT family N-acetyltransferase [Hamadaea sp.]NUR73138.1 GNAT family N-acetyltransferase [Hamadaea sp.]NUT20120.1 GNAT family N-acetyltransferase [Hamadaea sp.]
MSDLQIRPVRYGSPVAQRLVQAIFADQEARYGGSDGAPVEAMEFDPPEGAFLVAYLAGEPVGCGGWRSFDESEEVAELKRLYCAPEARNRGIASALVAAVEENAREHGRKRMILETGDRQPEAIALYTKLGYAPIEHYGFYKDEDGVVSLGRDL